MNDIVVYLKQQNKISENITKTVQLFFLFPEDQMHPSESDFSHFYATFILKQLI